MFRQSFKSIGVVFKCAPGLSVIKILQIAISAVLAPLSIYFTQRIIDAVTGIITNGEPWNTLAVWVGLLLFAMFFSSVGGGFLNGILYIAFRRRLNIGMMPVFVEKFKRLDYSCFEDKDVQDTLKLMSAEPEERLFNLFLNVLTVLECAVGVVGAALIFMQAGWWYVVGFAGLLVPMILLDFKAADMMQTMFHNQSTDERRMHYLGGLLSSKSSLFELKVFRATDYITKKWRGIANDVLDVRVKTTMRSQKYFLFSTILFKGWSFFIVFGLIYAIVNRSISIGLFTALITATGSVLNNADTLSHSVQNLRQRHLLMEHYFNFLKLPEVRREGKPLSAQSPHIVFENVTFSYPKTEKQVLCGVSFEVKQGERVALVGENGAGKSTIIKLLCGLYAPDGGRILINGVDIAELDPAELRRAFSVVFQDYCKYSLTLRENVAFGDLSKLSDDAALNAALEMGLAQGIAELDAPLGKLEESGIDISGGQWQRVAVARACLPDGAFVILDEPTASLDPVAESNMYHSFAQVLKHRGCIMISHRLASARMADKIVVLSGGAVTETGSHAQLMQSGGLYARMYESQSAWYVTAAEGGEPA